MKGSAFLLLIAIVVIGTGGFFYLKDTQGPVLHVQPDSGPISAKRPLALTASDSGGLKDLLVTARQGEKSVELYRQTFADGVKTSSQELLLDGKEFKDGPVVLHVQATDRSVYHFGRGNTTEQTFTVAYDARPPVISPVSTVHNLNRGGAGVIIYTVSEEVQKSGVQVGERFFPGHRQASGAYIAFFAFPWDLTVAQFSPRLLAVDLAGNERQTGFMHHVNHREHPKDRIEITDSFLSGKMPEFEPFFPGIDSPLELFLKVNRELRVENRRKLVEIGQQTAATKQWDGIFERLPNAAPRGRFADHRTYHYDGKLIDEQVHLGIDLASLAQSPVPAANHGKVVHAEDLGIYGLTVIIDHGLGLQTLYGHLSAIQVQVGDEIKKGQILGRTGATGMAGGDHLHFDVLLAGLPINPLEWWDESWINNNVTGKLSLTP
jgi:hypothetical protein